MVMGSRPAGFKLLLLLALLFFPQDSRKKDKLLCSQLQVIDFLQNFLAQEDVAQGLDPLASEDTSRE